MQEYSPIKVIREFRSLHPDDYHRIVYLFEEHENVFDALNFDHYFPALLLYVNALYHTGDFDKFLAYADRVLEQSIIEGVQFIDDEDIYTRTIYQKADALHAIGEYANAEKVSRELVRIDPYSPDHVWLLRRCILQQRPKYITFMVLAGVVGYIFSGMMVALNLLLIEPHYYQFLPEFNVFRKVIFVLGFIGIVGGVCIHVGTSIWKAHRFCNEAKLKKVG